MCDDGCKVRIVALLSVMAAAALLLREFVCLFASTSAADGLDADPVSVCDRVTTSAVAADSGSRERASASLCVLPDLYMISKSKS